MYFLYLAFSIRESQVNYTFFVILFFFWKPNRFSEMIYKVPYFYKLFGLLSGKYLCIKSTLLFTLNDTNSCISGVSQREKKYPKLNVIHITGLCSVTGLCLTTVWILRSDQGTPFGMLLFLFLIFGTVCWFLRIIGNLSKRWTKLRWQDHINKQIRSTWKWNNAIGVSGSKISLSQVSNVQKKWESDVHTLPGLPCLCLCPFLFLLQEEVACCI